MNATASEEYLLYHELTSQAWSSFLYAFYSVATALLVMFTLSHTYSNLWRSTRLQRARFRTMTRRLGVSTLNRYIRDVLIYFWIMLLVTIVVLPIYWTQKPKINKSVSACNRTWGVAPAAYMIGKLLMYRLLLAKSCIYDPMSQFKRLATATWWITNIIYAPLVIYLVFSVIYWSTDIIVVEGEETCITEFTLGAPVVLLVFDVLISCMCLLALAGPTLSDGASREVREAAWRNITFGGLTICSTIFLGTERQWYFAPVTIFIEVLVVDQFLNIILVALSWPTNYYKKMFYELFLCVNPNKKNGTGGSERKVSRHSAMAMKFNSRQKSHLGSRPGSQANSRLQSRREFASLGPFRLQSAGYGSRPTTPAPTVSRSTPTTAPGTNSRSQLVAMETKLFSQATIDRPSRPVH